MREVPPTHFGGRNFLTSMPRAREDVNVSNVIDIMTMFDEIEERGRKRSAKALKTPADKLSPIIPPNTDEVSPVSEGTTAGRVAREVSRVALGKRDGGKGHTIDSRHCRNMDGVKVVARKRKGVCRDKPIGVGAPTDIDVGVVFADALSETK